MTESRTTSISLDQDGNEILVVNEGCSLDDEVPCVFSESVFKPSLKLLDSITGEVVDYDNLYEIRIIGGGLTFDEMAAYSLMVNDILF